MTDYRRMYLDTAPLIYFLDKDVNYGDKVKIIFKMAFEAGKSIVTSTITAAEYLTYPYRTGNVSKINLFFEFMNAAPIEIMPIDISTAKKAAEIRADYTAFKMMDALQLASACVNQCDLFLTNDKQLCQFSEIRCLTVSEILF